MSFHRASFIQGFNLNATQFQVLRDITIFKIHETCSQEVETTEYDGVENMAAYPTFRLDWSDASLGPSKAAKKYRAFRDINIKIVCLTDEASSQHGKVFSIRLRDIIPTLHHPRPTTGRGKAQDLVPNKAAWPMLLEKLTANFNFSDREHYIYFLNPRAGHRIAAITGSSQLGYALRSLVNTGSLLSACR
jgi:hypothetical protein